MLFQQLLNGLGIGCTYALIALGYNLTFGVLKIVNLAYGEVFMAGAFAGLWCSILVPGNSAMIISVSILGSVITGLAVHILAVRPLGDVADLDSPRHLSVIVSTMGCSLILQNVALKIFGGYPRRFPRVIPDWFFRIAGTRVDLTIFINLSIALIVMVLLSLLLRRTKIGLRIRALSENRELAVSSGIRAGTDETITVIISSALAGVAAILILQLIGTVSPYVGLSYGFKGLVVLIVGGLGNMSGAVLIALLLGMSEVLTVAYVSSGYRDAVAFTVLVTLLIVREYRRRLSSAYS